MNPRRETRINFPPHIFTMIRAGRSHFSRPVDAIAEYVDNAIQACKDTPEPEIRVCLFLASLSYGFFLILDNGVGMDVRTIQDFATYSLDQNERGRAPTEGDKTFIGKFGVGAKEAGFYLGERIKLFTKPAKYDKEDVILTFCLDAEELLRRYNTQQEVYSGVVRELDIDGSLGLESDEKVFPGIKTILQHHFRTVPHGSAFLVKLRSELIVPELKIMPEDELKKQIMDIYHFHLHPEHNPENIANLIKDQESEESPRTTSSSSSSSSSRTQPIRTEDSLKLFYERCTTTSRREFALHSECDFFQKCVDRASDVFTVQIEAPLPRDAPRQNSRAASQLRSSDRCTIQGIFLYFPFKDGKETTPSMDDENNNQNIHIYWQNRLVPDEKRLSELFFFPMANSRREAVRKIARNWRGRVVGFLFFDWEFDFIANNKLRFIINPHDWFNKRVNLNGTITEPTYAGDAFLTWLVGCHQKDEEFTFSGLIRSSAPANQTFFQTVTFGQTGKKIKVADEFKINASNRSGAIVYGKVVEFVVDRALADDEIPFSGNGKVRYQRLPAKLFGSNVEEKSVKCIDPNDFVASPGALEILEKAIPKTVDVYLFEEASDKGTLMNNGDTNLFMSKTYFKFGIQIKGSDGKIVCHLPDSGDDSRRIRYSVSMRGVDEKMKDNQKTSDLFKYDAIEGEDVLESRILVGNRRNCFYSFYNITMTRQLGPRSFFVSVYSPSNNERIFEQEVRCNVVPMEPERFKIVTSGSFVQLGQSLCEFSVKFLDCMDQVVPFEGEIKIEITSEQMEVQRPDQSEAQRRKLTNRDQGVLLCKEGEWIVHPKPGVTIFSTVEVEKEKEVAFSVSLFVRKLNRFELFSSPVNFTVRCLPGPPAKFAVLEPNTQPVEVESGGTLNVLHVVMLDHWGHRVAPRTGNQQWSLRLGEGPLYLPTSNKAVSVFPPSGELRLLNIQCIEVDRSSIFQQSLNLYRTSGGRSSVVGEFQSTTLAVQVNASQRPSSIKIQRDGEDLSEFLTCTAGETLSKLTFAVFNESGEEMDESLLHLEKNSWRECSWIPTSRGKKKRETITSDFALPDIDIPENVSASPFEATLTVMLNGSEHSVTLSITIKPAEPAKWSLVHSPYLETQGVVVLDCNDLQNNICGAVCTDEFGNFVSIDTVASSSNSSSSCSVPFSPFLEVFIYNDDQMELEAEDSVTFQRIRLQPGDVMIGEESSTTKKRKRNEADAPVSMKGFVLPSSEFLNQPPDGKKVAVCIADDESKLNPSKSLCCPVVTSLPQHVLLSFGNATQSASEISTAVPNFSTIPDLYTHICDSHDNEASLRGIGATKIEILDSKGRKVFSVNDIEASIVPTPLNFDFLAVENDDEEGSVENPSMGDRVVKFECKMSYKRGGNTVTLPSAFLRCIVKKVNNVVDLKMQVLGGTENLYREHNSNIYSLTVTCGTAPPSLALMPMTDNGQDFLSVEDKHSFSYGARKYVGKTKSNITFTEVFNDDIDSNQHRLVLSPKEQLSSQQECVFDFVIVYEEKRGTLASLPEEKKHNKIRLLVHFVPGPLRQLHLNDFHMKKIQNRSVSNSKDPRQYRICDAVCLHGGDEFGNIVAFSPSHVARCRIVATKDDHLNSFQANPTLPRLLGADINGFITAKTGKNEKERLFSRIELDINQSSHWRDGEYFLHFSICESTSSDIDEELLPLYVPFQFTSDETNVLTRNELEDLKNQKEEYDDWEQQRGVLTVQMRNLQERCPPEIRSVGLGLDRLKQLRDQRTTQPDRRISTARPARNPRHAIINAANLGDEAKKVIGQVVDLGFVNDLDEAKLLSWATGRLMNAMIVKDKDTAKSLYNKGIKAWPLSHITPFNAGGKTTRQNASNENNLPLPRIVVSNIPPERQPRYLVNMIRLNPKHEHLRATVFFSIFSNSLLFHTMDDALLYRGQLTDQRNSPTLFTMGGEKLERNGVLDPEARARMPPNLDFIYGEQREETSSNGHALDPLDELIDAIEKLNDIENKMAGVNIVEINRKIKELEEKLGVTHSSNSNGQRGR